MLLGIIVSNNLISTLSEINEQVNLYLKDLSEISKYLKQDTEKGLAKKTFVDAYAAFLKEKYGNVLPQTLSSIRSDLIKIQNEAITLNEEDSEGYFSKDILYDSNNDIMNHLVLPYIIQGGLLYLVAAAKTGKSQLVSNLIYSIITGEPWLGCPVKQGNVLYYNLEEGKNSERKKCFDNGFIDSKFKSSMYNLRFEKDLDIANNIYRLEKHIETFNPVLVIIDTIRAAHDSSIREKDENWANPFQYIQRLAAKKDITVLALHHTNKQGQMASTSKLPGIGEGTILMERNLENNETILKFDTRDKGKYSLVLALERNKKRRYQYKLIREEGMSEEHLKIRTKLLQILLNEGTLNDEQLSSKFTANQHELVNSVLDKMLNNTLIQFKLDKNDNPIYYVPELIKTYLYSLPEYRDLDEVVKVAQKLKDVQDKTEVKNLIKNNFELANKALQSLSSKEQYDLAYKIFPPQQESETYKAVKFNYSFRDPKWQYKNMDSDSDIFSDWAK